MRSALILAFLLGSASAKGYNRSRTKLAIPKQDVGRGPTSNPNRGPTARIVGGAPVTPFEHNWVLAFRAGGYVCGASLIDEQWAMTAAHCTDGISAPFMQVGVHRHAYGLADNGEHDCAETVDIAEKHEHPEYNSVTLENDIALLRLSQPVGCVGSITMPSLDHGSYSGADTTVTVAGWGVTTEDGSSPDVLHSVDLTLLTNAQCENYGYSGDLVDSMICAIGDLEGGEDSCQGDSGGPLFAQQGGEDIIVGVVSWGYGCARKGVAGVYTRVSSYTAWIEATSGVATQSPPALPSPPSSPPLPPSPPVTPPPPSPPPSEPAVPSVVSVTADEYNNEVSWELNCDRASAPITGGSPYEEMHAVP
eukprot:CAMPEP_0118809406 /NCGR_PEP_ID=MMETSP1162-20130426/251_1 /TAXON_ID=33656 /ORGANISM="Phaeocystis Sp, Strain CCMP2710" /LENGTH=362 /DNA_ID=CAMNT_0006738835 /DNA_START=54 /DNA_END=1138 /DNA_ORIENTATION=+